MQRADDTQAAELAAQVQAFVSQNRILIEPGSGSVSAWFQALREQQWYIPHWPAANGGLDWNPLQLYILQRELLRAGAPLPSGATTHLLASWLFRWLPQQQALMQAQGQRWLAGIAGRWPDDEDPAQPERWRVGVDLRQPDWPGQALAGEVLDTQAHWVLQPYPLAGGTALEADRERGLQGIWALGVLPGALLPAQAQKLNTEPSHKAFTEVELVVEQRWPPILSGLKLAQLEALLKPIQLAWQNLDASLTAPLGASAEIEQGLLVPSLTLGWRLERLQQVLAVEDGLQAQLDKLHESQIALSALQVMEARALQADALGKPLLADGLPGAELRQAVDQSAERLGWRIAQLEADTLGYFALPVFDVSRQHNEGRVTPALYDGLLTNKDTRS